MDQGVLKLHLPKSEELNREKFKLVANAARRVPRAWHLFFDKARRMRGQITEAESCDTG